MLRRLGMHIVTTARYQYLEPLLDLSGLCSRPFSNSLPGPEEQTSSIIYSPSSSSINNPGNGNLWRRKGHHATPTAWPDQQLLGPSRVPLSDQKSAGLLHQNNGNKRPGGLSRVNIKILKGQALDPLWLVSAIKNHLKNKKTFLNGRLRLTWSCVEVEDRLNCQHIDGVLMAVHDLSKSLGAFEEFQLAPRFSCIGGLLINIKLERLRSKFPAPEWYEYVSKSSASYKLEKLVLSRLRHAPNGTGIKLSCREGEGVQRIVMQVACLVRMKLRAELRDCYLTVAVHSDESIEGGMQSPNIWDMNLFVTQ